MDSTELLVFPFHCSQPFHQLNQRFIHCFLLCGVIGQLVKSNAANESVHWHHISYGSVTCFTGHIDSLQVQVYWDKGESPRWAIAGARLNSACKALTDLMSFGTITLLIRRLMTRLLVWERGSCFFFLLLLFFPFCLRQHPYLSSHLRVH